MSLRGLANSHDPHITYSLILVYHQSNLPATQFLSTWRGFQQEVNKMLQVGVLKPVQEATPWISSFVLVEGKVKSDNLKLRICLDPTSLNKAIVRVPYHFKTPEDIAHLIADACIMTVWYWHQQLDEASWYLTTFNTECGRFCYTVMPFGTTVAGDVFQSKLDQCFVQIENVIVIADDIMIVGKRTNHSDHDQALTTLLDTARKCNVCLNCDKLQYKVQEVDLFGETYKINGCKPVQTKCLQSQKCHPIPIRSKFSHSLAWLIISQSSLWDCQTWGTHQGALQRKSTL